MIKSVWMETRPALSCCQVCLVLKKKVSRSSIIIRVRKSELVLEVNGKVFQITFEDFAAEPLTLTGIKATEQFLNFRIQVETRFKLKSIYTSKSEPPFAQGDKSTLTCLCFNHLSKDIIFDRILPLPSSDINLSDMFCHLNEGPLSSKDIFSPKSGDCYYSDHMVVVNEDVVTGCYNSGKFSKCKRCLATVGTCRNDSVHFWTSCLNLGSGNLSPLKRLQNLVLKVLADPYALFPHILLESEETESFLFVVVVDKNLILTKCSQDLKLKSEQVVKVKYNYYPTCNAQVKSMKSDPFNNVHHAQVDKSFLEYTLRYLTSSSKSIPLIFSKIDGGCMAYLNLGD